MAVQNEVVESAIGENNTYTQNFTVQFSYSVHFTEHAFDRDNAVLVEVLARQEEKKRHRLAVFLDSEVARLMPDVVGRIQVYAQTHADRIELAAPPELVAGGEAIKNDPTAFMTILRRLAELHIDRHSFVLAIGGGAVLDIVGYAAACAHRGVRLIRMPTTVLAQNDSGVGVKTGMNAFGVKNMIGAFAPPFAVINDARFLETLSQRDRIAGMAEAVKVALIRDGAFFAWLEHNADELSAFRRPFVGRMIRRCAELHMRQIAHGGDPFEAGSARPLDFGHWAAHRLETLSGYDLRHGEAVAIGIALDARYSVLAGLLAAGEDRRIHQLLKVLGFRLWHDALLEVGDDGDLALLQGLEEFREHLGGALTVTLLAGIGRGHEVHEIDTGCMREAIAWLQAQEHPQCS